jgi:hypothetical protein
MWLYPVPALLAIIGFVYIVLNRHDSAKEIRYAAVILIAGLILYMVRSWHNRDWPFSEALPAAAEVRGS